MFGRRSLPDRPSHGLLMRQNPGERRAAAGAAAAGRRRTGAGVGALPDSRGRWRARRWQRLARIRIILGSRTIRWRSRPSSPTWPSAESCSRLWCDVLPTVCCGSVSVLAATAPRSGLGLADAPYVVTDDERQFDDYAQVAENEQRAPLQPLELAAFIAGSWPRARRKNRGGAPAHRCQRGDPSAGSGRIGAAVCARTLPLAQVPFASLSVRLATLSGTGVRWLRGAASRRPRSTGASSPR